MTIGLVLVIEDDEWVSRLLSVAIREAGFEAEVCNSAEKGLAVAIRRQPDCIVCDVDLPDHDGYWVAQQVRTDTSRVSVTPFLFLSGLDDQESRLQGFHVGADVYMTKPFRVDEVVAQVSALVQMATRLRKRRDTFLSVPPEEGSAIEGDLAQMSIATVLTVLEMERRTGSFEVHSKKRVARMGIAGGAVETGTIGGSSASPLESLRTILAWTVGRFAFSPQEHRDAPSNTKSIGALLIEACRLNDEAANEGGPPSSRLRGDRKSTRLEAPSLGGPASDVTDLTPPGSTAEDATKDIEETTEGTPTVEDLVTPESVPPNDDSWMPPPPALPTEVSKPSPSKRASKPPANATSFKAKPPPPRVPPGGQKKSTKKSGAPNPPRPPRPIRDTKKG